MVSSRKTVLIVFNSSLQAITSERYANETKWRKRKEVELQSENEGTIYLAAPKRGRSVAFELNWGFGSGQDTLIFKYKLRYTKKKGFGETVALHNKKNSVAVTTELWQQNRLRCYIFFSSTGLMTLEWPVIEGSVD